MRPRTLITSGLVVLLMSGTTWALADQRPPTTDLGPAVVLPRSEPSTVPTADGAVRPDPSATTAEPSPAPRSRTRPPDDDSGEQDDEAPETVPHRVEQLTPSPTSSTPAPSPSRSWADDDRDDHEPDGSNGDGSGESDDG